MRVALVGTVLSLGVVSCTDSRRVPVERVPVSEVVTPVDASSGARRKHDADVPGAREPCEPAAVDEAPHREWPTWRGAGTRADVVPWFAARGVARDALLEHLVRLTNRAVDRHEAEAMLGARQPSLRVGPRAEEAIWVEYSVKGLLMARHGMVLVVRAGRPQVVLDVGLGLSDTDEESHPLDLGIAFEPDGLAATLDDLAPEGTVVGPTKEEQRASYHQRLDCCERLASTLSAQRAARLPEGTSCPLSQRTDGAWRLTDGPMYRSAVFSEVSLHGCASGLSHARELARVFWRPEHDGQGTLRSTEAMCAQRGRWVWSAGRFVRETPARASQR